MTLTRDQKVLLVELISEHRNKAVQRHNTEMQNLQFEHSKKHDELKAKCIAELDKLTILSKELV